MTLFLPLLKIVIIINLCIIINHIVSINIWRNKVNKHTYTPYDYNKIIESMNNYFTQLIYLIALFIMLLFVLIFYSF
jgi:hypothetical protein